MDWKGAAFWLRQLLDRDEAQQFQCDDQESTQEGKREIHYILIYEPSPKGYRNEVELGFFPWRQWREDVIEEGRHYRTYYCVSDASLRRLERMAAKRLWRMLPAKADPGQKPEYRLYAPGRDIFGKRKRKGGKNVRD